VGDGGAWLRRQCLIMARTNSTPAAFWLSMPLRELPEWISDNNYLIEQLKGK